ncbi:MAG: hypothetical protein HUU38_27620 [Anaerolineales bacterium]|nr:hypothetical protein [Anaerolineales bacterium]
MNDKNEPTPTWTAPTVLELTLEEAAEQANLSLAYGTSEDNPYDDRDHC